ncbi:MAG: hypothetical protein HQM08_27545 [Candidatus Riflebacteria bacterium]|nr:hypothetical protein [Candidatus Riflebacteria bacterium]
MQARKFYLIWSLFVLTIFLSVSLFGAPTDGKLEKLFIEFSKEIQLQKNAANSSEISVTYQSISNDKCQEIKKFMAQLSSENELSAIFAKIEGFERNVSSDAQLAALQCTLSCLEERIKFLSQTESLSFSKFLPQIASLRINISKKQNSQKKTPAILSSINTYSPKPQFSQQTSRASRDPSSERLGAIVANGKTSFSVYSPDATEVSLVVFEKAEDTNGQGYKMAKGQDGIWRAIINGELYGKFYGFMVDGPKTAGFLFDPKRLLSDPYALANVNHDGKSIIVKTDFNWTDDGFVTPAPKDLIIYESHVKDLTADSSSGVSEKNKGKYLGLLEGKGTDAILGHLTDLGITAVELLPCHEFDNNFAGHLNYWGYMTSHYFAPECSYASGKNGEAVKEFKQMVNGLHKAGLAVIMDVVFNHTTEGNEQGVPINFKGLDNPGYYRLTPDKKYYMNGAGCGNEFRSDNPMTQKYILDSLNYWVKEYHVDGFRFDLGPIIDRDTMGRIINELPPNVILVGEPWACDWQRAQWGKGNFRNTRFGKWNDDFREKVRAFMGGNASRNDLITVLAGSCFWWAGKPTESVNYLESHDGATMCDMFHGDKARIKLGGVALLTAQGIPMLQEGQDFMRNKKGNDNSYDQDNDVNWLNYTYKKQNQDIFDFYRGLIQLRKKYPNFRHDSPLTDKQIEWYQPPDEKALGFRVFGDTDLIVLLNSDSNTGVTFNLPDQIDWKIICNGNKVDDSGQLGSAKYTYFLPPLTAVILKNK